MSDEDRAATEERLRGTDDDARGILNHLLADLPGVVYRCRNDRKWTVLGITANVDRLTGYDASEFIEGEQVWADLIHPDDRERVWGAVQEALEERQSFRITYRIRTRSGEDRWVLEQGQVAKDADPQTILTGYIQDLTGPIGAILENQQAKLEETREERRLVELLQTVTSIVNEFRSFEAALQAAVPAICSALGFDVGHVFLSDPNNHGALRSTEIWHLGETGGLEEFRKATESGSWSIEEGLPGRVMESGSAEWVEDVREAPDFFRVSSDQPSPVRSGLAAPIFSEDRPLGVLEIYSVDPRPPDAGVAAILRQIGVQLGRVWEREEAVRTQRRSERRFQQLAENVEAVFVLTDLDGKVLYVSPGFETITGVARTPGSRSDLLAIVHPEDRDRMDRLLADRERAPYRVEYRIVREDGEVRWIRQRAFPIQNDQGEVYRIGSLAEDVTDEHRAREAIERTTRLLEQTISSLEEAVLVVDTERQSRKVVEANAAAEEIFGYPREELVGKSTEVLHVNPEARERFAEEEVSALESDGVFHAAYPLKRKDGTVFQAEQTVTLLDPERGLEGGVVSVIRDVSEQAEAEARLRESETRFRQIAEHVDDVFWISSPDRDTMEYVSPAFERVWGRTVDELYRDPGTWLRAIHPEDRERIRAAVPTQANGEYEEEYRIVRPDGEVCWIWERAFPVEDADGTVRRVVGVAEDITERKELEWQLTQAQKMEAVGRLAGGIAHDFNNILTVISAQSDLLLLDLESTALQEEVELILNSAERAARLTRQLLAFSREQVLRPRVVDLNETIAGMEHLLRRVLGEDIRIRIRLGEPLPPVRVDVGQLEQVIMNLVINAREAMPGGGILEISTMQEILDTEEAAGRRGLWPGPNVCLRVSDTGMGMEEEVRSRVFEPFFTTKRDEGGTGLGLAVSYGIVKQSGGAIHVESKPGEGTTFKIRFPPAEDADSAADPATGDRERHRAITGRVLAVEDDPSVRRIVRRILERAGIEVEMAGDAETGLEILQESGEDIEVVLTDLVLPGMSGRDLLEEIRERGLDPRVVVMSGYDRDSPGNRGDLPPDVEFIQKPFSPDELLEVLHAVLGGGAPSRE